MGEVIELRKIKALKVVKKDLEYLVPIIELQVKTLSNYKHYRVISPIVTTMEENLKTMKAHLEKCKQILNEGKGKK